MTESVISAKKARGAVRGGAAYISRLIRLFIADPEGRVSSFYELNDRQITGASTYREVTGVKSLYVNYGYWAPGCADNDEAMIALADVLADAAGIAEGERVLDVGFGYGEQDIHWARTRRPAQIVGLNVTPAQVRLAQERVRAQKLTGVLDLRVGSATAIPFAEESFDRVVALESALHFNTRQKFFEEAHRVLRPGGVLATADVLPRRAPDGTNRIVEWLDKWARRAVVPSDNWYTIDVYPLRLERAGFTDVSVRSITDRTIKPRAEFVKERLAAHQIQRLSWGQRQGVRTLVRSAERSVQTRDYILAVARKPVAG
ncbi:class I SAM-dependent methyltransferase [Spirillospora sp. NBC_00431]